MFLLISSAATAWAQIPDTATGHRLAAFVDYINRAHEQGSEKGRMYFLRNFFLDQTDKSVKDRNVEIMATSTDVGRLRFDELLFYDHKENSIVASYSAQSGNTLKISLTLAQVKPPQIEEYSLERVEMVNAGKYVDNKVVSQQGLEEQVKQILAAVNSNDKEEIRRYIKEWTYPAFQESDSSENLIELFLEMYKRSGGLEFYSVREYENSTDTFVVCRNKKTNGWNAIAFRIEPTSRSHTDRIRFLTVQAPQEFDTSSSLPETPAGRRLSEVIECINQSEVGKRADFLKTGFVDEDEFEMRSSIAGRIHSQFAPLAFHKLVESQPHQIVAQLSTSSDVILQFEIEVAKEGDNRISDVGMEPVEKQSTVSLPEGMYSLFNDETETIAIARGIWHAEGYGYVFDVAEKGLTVYNITAGFAWKQEFEDSLFVQPGKNQDRAVFTLHPLEPGYNVVRLEKLPKICTLQLDWTPTELFEAYTEIFESHYPFFELRNVNWQERKSTIRPRINDEMSELELFEAMREMIKDIDDCHVSLTASIDGKSQRADTGGDNIIRRLRSNFRPSDEFKTFRSYFRNWRSQQGQNITEQLLAGKGRTDADGQIIWGRVHEKIGYIFIGGMGGYSLGNTDQQVSELHRVLNESLIGLFDAEAIIVDVSMNGGGMDLFSLEIASHFADKRALGFSKWPSSHQKYRLNRFVTPLKSDHANGATYTKPVYVVTSNITASAAEIFTMCMRALPNVTTIGESTEGGLSDILPKTLPNGWELGLSNEIYVDHEGVCHERSGVPPEIPMDIFDSEDLTKIDHAKSIQKVVSIVLGRIGK